ADRLHYLAALTYSNATATRHVGAPDRALGIYADSVRSCAIELGPHSTPRKIAVRRDVVGGQRSGIGLSHNQRRVVRCDCHAVREGQVLGNLARRPVLAARA